MRNLVAVIVGGALLCAASSAGAEWRRFETEHFIIYSESNDKRVNELAGGLEAIDGLMHLATGLTDEVKPVKVRIYEMPDEEAVQAALGDPNSGVAGFYTSNVLGPFAVTLRRDYEASGDFTPTLVLHHEYAHHFMLQYFPAIYPKWYVEGFAELIGSSKTLPDGRIAYGWPARHRGDEIAADWVNVKDVLLKAPEKLGPFDLYGQGWAMTHFLTFSKQRSPQMRRYLEALTAGKSAAEAAHAFGDLDALNKEARAYLQQGSFAYTPVKVPVHQPVIEKVSPVARAEAALIPETIAFRDVDLSLYRKDGDRERASRQRAAVLKRIREKAAQFPGDPYALYLLAQAENVSGDKHAAEAAVDRLLALQPTHVGAMALKSLLMSDAAEALAGDARKAKASEARHLAMAANSADPDNPLAYVAFYRSYPAAGEPVPPGALEGLFAAVEKLPGNTRVRQLLVDELSTEHRYADAMQVLMPLAADPHESPLRQAAIERMAKLKALAEASAKAAQPSAN